MVFNTKIINFINDLYYSGENWREMFTETPFYQNNPCIRKENLTFHATKEELAEYVKCSRDIVYFAEKYCKIRTEDGTVSNIKLRDYQIEYLRNVKDKRYLICVKSRQIGISVMNAIYILHYSIFSNDKNILIASNMRATSIEVVSKIQDIYCNLPFFMKPGIKTWNQSSLSFDNGCRIRTTGRTKSAIGFSIDHLFIEEMAHIPSNIIEPFYTALFKMISSSPGSKITLGSTPNGKNLFYKLYTSSIKEDNDYYPMCLPYTVIKTRDDKWKEQTIKDIGGMEEFEQEFELKFHDSKDSRIKTIEDKIDELTGNTLIDEMFNNETGDVAKFKLPSIPELLKRVEQLEKNMEILIDINIKSSGDFFKAQKVLENPGQVTWENVEAYKKRLEDLKWAQNKYGEEFDKFKFDVYNGTYSTPFS